MSKRKTKRSAGRTSDSLRRSAPGPEPRASKLRLWLLAAATALFVGGTLLPGESEAWRGDSAAWIMLWIVLGLIWCLAQIGQKRLEFRFGATDAAVAVMIGCMVVSAVWAATHAAPRASINSMWQWVALALAFFLTRQLVRTTAEARAMLAAMLALSVALSAIGLHEYFIDMPQTRREYAADPDAALREAGLWYPSGSRKRELFEQRLASTEPTATFVLTNSLAGVLAPWLVLGLGAAVMQSGRSNPQFRRRLWMAAACCTLPIGAVLLLTKSRSAYAAVVAGALLVGWLIVRQRRRISPRFAIAAVLVVAALIVAAVAVGGLDTAVVLEAPKSLGYRLQYWQSTLQMIGDHPLLGCGSGNFQDYYTAYKLPDASEDVADPHNFALEVWAVAGTPALLALLTAMATFGWAMVRFVPPTETSVSTSDDASSDASRYVIGGALAGFVVAFLLGPLVSMPLTGVTFVAGLTIAAAVLWLWWPWIVDGELPTGLAAIAASVLFINLMAAGGIGFVSVASSLWLLLAVGLSLSELDRPPRVFQPRAAYVFLIGAVAVAAIYYFSAYRPTIQCRAALAKARSEPRRVEEHLQAAARADPLSAEPWQHLAELRLVRWRRTPREETRAALEEAQDHVMELDPHSAISWFAAGQRYSKVFESTGVPADSDLAVAALREATRLDPTNARFHAHLAVALAAAGQNAEAARTSTRALQLDRDMPHADRKLQSELRDRLRRMPNGSN